MSRDLRKYSRQTNFRLFIGFFLILFILGDGLIWYFYGKTPAIFGLLCLVGGTFPIILIAGILWIMERVVEGQNDR